MNGLPAAGAAAGRSARGPSPGASRGRGSPWRWRAARSGSPARRASVASESEPRFLPTTITRAALRAQPRQPLQQQLVQRLLAHADRRVRPDLVVRRLGVDLVGQHRPEPVGHPEPLGVLVGQQQRPLVDVDRGDPRLGHGERRRRARSRRTRSRGRAPRAPPRAAPPRASSTPVPMSSRPWAKTPEPEVSSSQWPQTLARTGTRRNGVDGVGGEVVLRPRPAPPALAVPSTSTGTLRGATFPQRRRRPAAVVGGWSWDAAMSTDSHRVPQHRDPRGPGQRRAGVARAAQRRPPGHLPGACVDAPPVRATAPRRQVDVIDVACWSKRTPAQRRHRSRPTTSCASRARCVGASSSPAGRGPAATRWRPSGSRASPGARGQRRVGRVARPPPGSARARASPSRRVASRARRSTCPAQSGSRRPSPTATRQPISARTIEWQNASARTVATATPSSPVPVQVQQRAHRGRPLAAPAEGGEVVLAEQARRRPRSSPRGRAAAARPPPGRGPAGPRPGAGRRSGRRSDARARRSARRTRPAPRRRACTRTSGVEHAVEPPGQGCDRGVAPPADGRRDQVRPRRRRGPPAPRACTPVSVRPATVSVRALGPQHRVERALHVALHRAQARLPGPAVEPGTVVGEIEAQPHPAHPAVPACNAARVRFPLRLLVLFTGCVVLGLGVAMLLTANLGSDGYSTLVRGLSLRSGLAFWSANLVVGVLFLAVAATRGVYPGLGTIVQVLLVGGVVTWLLQVFDTPGSLVARAVLLVGGHAGAGASASRPTSAASSVRLPSRPPGWPGTRRCRSAGATAPSSSADPSSGGGSGPPSASAPSP